jgi:phosphomethylpyrimidine synthase
MSIREDAIDGKITPVFEICAKNEGVSIEYLLEGVAKGVVAIPKNNNHNFDRIIAVGRGLSTKVNANIGSSKDHQGVEQELQKLCAALKAGTDAVMDLSMGGDLNEVRKEILRNCPIPLGTVPIYQSVAEVVENQKKEIGEVTVAQIFDTIRQQAEDGVDFMTIHCGITKNTLERLNNHQRLMGVVSRGGSFCIEWMSYNKKENPFYEHYDELLALLKEPRGQRTAGMPRRRDRRRSAAGAYTSRRTDPEGLGCGSSGYC